MGGGTLTLFECGGSLKALGSPPGTTGGTAGGGIGGMPSGGLAPIAAANMLCCGWGMPIIAANADAAFVLVSILSPRRLGRLLNRMA